MIHYNMEVVLRDEYDIPTEIKFEHWIDYLPDSIWSAIITKDTIPCLRLTDINSRILMDKGWWLKTWKDLNNHYIVTLEHDAVWNDALERLVLIHDTD